MANRDVLLSTMGAVSDAHEYLAEYFGQLHADHSLPKEESAFFLGALRSLSDLHAELHARPELAEFRAHLKPAAL